MLFTKRAPVAEVELGGERVLARGERTVLREFERADVDHWLAWPRHRDPLFETYNPPMFTERQRELYYQQRLAAHDSRQFSVDDLHGEFVGRISIRDIDWRLGAAVLGISFHPGRLNRGLGTDALWTFLGYYFGPAKMSVLFLDVAAFNHRAYRVYEKCGFRKCGQRWGEPQTDAAGIFRKPEFANIRYLFQWQYGLVRPLLIDMVLRREAWEQVRRQGSRADASTHDAGE
jgi:diamine N-acetyltransferase